jgi:hypothetical protein
MMDATFTGVVATFKTTMHEFGKAYKTYATAGPTRLTGRTRT